jgi:hypothetical protein
MAKVSGSSARSTARGNSVGGPSRVGSRIVTRGGYSAVMTEPGAGSVRHPHGGAEWDIPVALLEVQRRFDEADALCAQLAQGDDLDAYRAAQARRLEEVLALHRHPWLVEHAAAGRRHKADSALKHLARSANS